MNGESCALLDENRILDMYMREAGKYPVLSTEETFELLRRAKDGDMAAREKLICHNLRFVVKIARQMQGRGMSLADLIAEGNVGLCIAIEKYDFNHESSTGDAPYFTTESFWWIHQAMQRGIDNKARMIRIPVHEKANLIKILYRLNGGNDEEAVDFEQACRAEGRPVEKMRQIYSVYRNPDSLDRPVVIKGSPKTGSDSLLQDVIPDQGRSDELMQETVMKENLKQEMERLLNEREREVLKMRFGIEKEYPMTLTSIAEHFMVSKERIRQVEVKALRKLRQSIVLRDWQFA